MQTYATRSGLKRAMDSIIVGAFTQAVEENRIQQTTDGRWFEQPPRSMAVANRAFLNVKKGDASLVTDVEKQNRPGGNQAVPCHSYAL